MIKTTQELVQILKWLNGANDVEIYPVPLDRGVDFNADWSFAGLNLFKNGALLFVSDNFAVFSHSPRL